MHKPLSFKNLASLIFILISSCSYAQYWNKTLQYPNDQNQAGGFHVELTDDMNEIYGVNIRANVSFMQSMGVIKYVLDSIGTVVDSIFTIDKPTGFYGANSGYNIISRLNNGKLLCARTTGAKGSLFTQLSLFSEQMDTIWTKQLVPNLSGEFAPAGSLPLNEDQYILVSGNNHNATNTNGYRITIGNANGDLLADNYYYQNENDFEFSPKNFLQYGQDSLLMWGECANPLTLDWGVFAVKADFNATSATFLTFGNPDQCPESLPDATMLANNNLLMAYGHCQGQGMNGFPHYEQLHLVEINPASMTVIRDTVIQMPMLDNLLTTGMHVQKLMLTSDGGILVTLVQSTSSYVVSTYLVRLTSDLALEWIKKFDSNYNPPSLTQNDSSVFDVLQTTDNGFLCTGFVQSYTTSIFEQKLWAFRVDACGELVFSNCPLTSHTEAIAQSSLFELWPNPSIGKVLFHSAENTQSVNVLDMNGAVVASNSPKSTQFELDLSQLPVGLYIVRATSQNGDFSYQKLVISR